MLQQIKKVSKVFTSLLTSSTYYTACTMHFSVQHLKEKMPRTLQYSVFEYIGNVEYHYPIHSGSRTKYMWHAPSVLL